MSTTKRRFQIMRMDGERHVIVLGRACDTTSIDNVQCARRGIELGIEECHVSFAAELVGERVPVRHQRAAPRR